MVTSIADALQLVRTIISFSGHPEGHVAASQEKAARSGLARAVARRDTPALYDWLIESFSFQGISDRIAWSYIASHGNASWEAIEASFESTRCQCPKLGSFETFTGCRYRKAPRSCAEPAFIASCPLPHLPLRKGDLNQLAYSLYYFLSDRCDGDLVGFIDRLFAGVDQVAPADPAAAKADALVAELSQVFGVSNKVIAMAFSVLLVGADPAREDWVLVGQQLVAIDSLVHNFLHRTGILAMFGVAHPYGDRCYGAGGCETVVRELARRLSASARRRSATGLSPYLVQFAIWQFCAETRANICNGRKIDDRFSCTNQACPVGELCSRTVLKTAPPSLSEPELPGPVG
jgi:hypothetical protein